MHKRLDSLTSLRWWAAFGVFGYHMANLAPLRHQSLLNVGYTGVSFFFVLSGFVLTWSAAPSTGIRQFWWRRFARIWPAHLVALIPCLFVFYSFSTPPDDQSWVKQFSLPVIALSIILLQGFSTQPAVLFSGNPAAWTLSCEAFFYFLHPLVNSRTTMKKKIAFALLTCAIGVGIVMCLRRASELVISPPLERVWEFFLGMALAHLLRAGVRFQLPPWSAYIMIAGVIAFYWLLNSRYHDHPSFFITSLHTLMPVILALIYALMIAICASADIEGRYSPLRHRFLVTGGEWSYAFYLVHATVLYSFKSFTGLIPWGVWTIPVWCVVFIIALAAAGGLHLLIEKPLEKRLRRWGDLRFGNFRRS